MDSRRFGVFLVAIFLFASFQVPAIAQTSDTASGSTTVAPSSTVDSSPAAAVTEAAKPSVENNTTSSKPAAEGTTAHESGITVPTTKGPAAGAVDANSASAAPATPATPVKATESEAVRPEVSTKSESAPTTTLPTPTNSQSVRDVAVETCSSGFQALQKESLIPEKVILSVAGGMTAAQFCNQTTVIEKLKTTCANMKADEGVEGAKAAPIAAGLAAMFSAVCSNVEENLPVVAGSGVECNEALMQTTKKCTASMKTPYSYPTEMLYHEMMNSSCTMLDEFKNCVSKGMETNCSSVQQQAVSKIMAAVMKDHQCSSATTVPTTKAPEPAPEPAPTTKAAPVLPSQPKNSGTYFQLNIFTLLPILLSLAFKFY